MDNKPHFDKTKNKEEIVGVRYTMVYCLRVLLTKREKGNRTFGVFLTVNENISVMGLLRNE